MLKLIYVGVHMGWSIMKVFNDLRIVDKDIVVQDNLCKKTLKMIYWERKCCGRSMIICFEGQYWIFYNTFFSKTWLTFFLLLPNYFSQKRLLKIGTKKRQNFSPVTLTDYFIIFLCVDVFLHTQSIVKL